jgi:hypothetical protein
MKITMTVELDFESWFEQDEPKTEHEWSQFFLDHLTPYPASVIGTTHEEHGQQLIALNSWSIDVTKIEYND